MKATGMTMRLVLSGPVFTVPMAFGIIMTVIASLGSARSATAVTPLEALRPIELTDTRRAGVVRAVISVLLVVAGVALCAFSVCRCPRTSPDVIQWPTSSIRWCCSPPSSDVH